MRRTIPGNKQLAKMAPIRMSEKEQKSQKMIISWASKSVVRYLFGGAESLVSVLFVRLRSALIGSSSPVLDHHPQVITYCFLFRSFFPPRVFSFVLARLCYWPLIAHIYYYPFWIYLFSDAQVSIMDRFFDHYLFLRCSGHVAMSFIGSSVGIDQLFGQAALLYVHTYTPYLNG